MHVPLVILAVSLEILLLPFTWDILHLNSHTWLMAPRNSSPALFSENCRSICLENNQWVQSLAVVTRLTQWIRAAISPHTCFHLSILCIAWRLAILSHTSLTPLGCRSSFTKVAVRYGPGEECLHSVSQSPCKPGLCLSLIPGYWALVEEFSLSQGFTSRTGSSRIVSEVIPTHDRKRRKFLSTEKLVCPWK